MALFSTRSFALGAAASAVLAMWTAAPELTPEPARVLGHMNLVDLDDGTGALVRTIRISGVKVQIVNGAGSTESSNGLRNLLVGYQELGNEVEPDLRTGSHYVVVGRRHNYTSFGGILAGESNSATGVYGSVAGGRRNRAAGPWSSIAGGAHNRPPA